MINISAAIITLNEEARIDRCLSSLSFCDEIVLVDSGSTDDTRAIAREYTDRIYVNEFKGDGWQKNNAVSKTRGRWVFLIDADEVVPPALSAEILNTVNEYGDSPSLFTTDADRPAKPVAWEIPRRNYVGDIWVKHGGWFPDYQTRLWLKGKARNAEVKVHSGLIVDGSLGRLTEPLDHYTHDSLENYRSRMISYAAGRAEDYLAQGRRAGPWSPFLHQTWAFFRAYLLRAGFRDGVLGWRLALTRSVYTKLKYQNLRSLQHRSIPE